jgi:hypothetical protein
MWPQRRHSRPNEHISDSVKKEVKEVSGSQPYSKTQEVDSCGIPRPGWNRCDGYPECLHRFLMLRKTVDELVQYAVS